MSLLVDSHCHLDFPQLSEDLDGVLARAQDSGVGMMLTISTKLEKFPAVRAIAEAHEHIYCSVGVHPHEAEAEPDTMADILVRESAHPKVIAIGETGLDYFYEHSPRDVQQAVFRQHIQASRDTGLPIIIHTREADEDTVAILREEMGQGAFPGLIHCFTSSQWLAEECLDMGLSISISGIATFKSAQAICDTIAIIPPERLLVETDAPFLAPVPMRGKSNEPGFVAHTAAKVAEIKGMSPGALAELTTDNFFALFAKADRAQLAA